MGLTTGGIVTFAALHRDQMPTGDVIVVLGAGMSADGTLHQSSINRVSKGVALYLAGAAPRIHFTGGRAVPDGPSAGAQMAAVALSLGVDAAAISIEEQSLSTLQNALFSKPMLAGRPEIILVTEGFHLPRAAGSFWWMGMDQLHLVHANRFRRTGSGAISMRMIGREALAVWFNLGRATIWSLTGKGNNDILQ